MDDWTPALMGAEPTMDRYTLNIIADGERTWGTLSLALESNTNEIVVALFERLAQTTICTEVLAGVVGLVPAPNVLSRTFGGCSLSTSDSEEEDFEVKNRRRIHLIDRQFDRGLTEGEFTELAELRASVVTSVNNEHPFPLAS